MKKAAAQHPASKINFSNQNLPERQGKKREKRQRIKTTDKKTDKTTTEEP